MLKQQIINYKLPVWNMLCTWYLLTIHDLIHLLLIMYFG